GAGEVDEEERKEKRLVAYVSANSSPTLWPKELRRFLQQKLPEYMLPAVFSMVDTLPLLPSGKVNRRALASMAVPAGEISSVVKGPSEPLELRLQLIFERVL